MYYSAVFESDTYVRARRVLGNYQLSRLRQRTLVNIYYGLSNSILIQRYRRYTVHEKNKVKGRDWAKIKSNAKNSKRIEYKT